MQQALFLHGTPGQVGILLNELLLNGGPMLEQVGADTRLGFGVGGGVGGEADGFGGTTVGHGSREDQAGKGYFLIGDEVAVLRSRVGRNYRQLQARERRRENPLPAKSSSNRIYRCGIGYKRRNTFLSRDYPIGGYFCLLHRLEDCHGARSPAIAALGEEAKDDYLLTNPTIRNAKAIVRSTTRQR